MERFGQRLQRLRNERGLSQQELAKKVGASRSSISMYECDDRWPDFEVLDNLADYFDVSFDYLLCRAEVNSGYPAHNFERRMLSYAEKLTAAYQKASPDTQAAVRAILHVEDNNANR